MDGEGVQRDVAEVMRLFGLAAAQGHADNTRRSDLFCARVSNLMLNWCVNLKVCIKLKTKLCIKLGILFSTRYLEIPSGSGLTAD